MTRSLVGLAGILSLALAGCGGTEQADAPPAVEKPKAPQIADAKQVADALSAAGLPLGKVRVMTAETDGNKLLGRPGQYTSKIDFIDTRFPENEIEEATNYIEVFDNLDDAQRRHDYVEGVGKSAPMFLQYLILKKNVLVRLDKEISPSVAKEYETALEKIVG